MAERGKADRFYANPILRDEEWNRATQPSWPLMALAVAIVGIAFYYGFYGSPSQRATGWIIAILTMVIYTALGRMRRVGARGHLRSVHSRAGRR